MRSFAPIGRVSKEPGETWESESDSCCESKAIHGSEKGQQRRFSPGPRVALDSRRIGSKPRERNSPAFELKKVFSQFSSLPHDASYLVQRHLRQGFEHMATEHPVVTADQDRVYNLRLWNHDFMEGRCTDNFSRYQFLRGPCTLRLDFVNVPLEEANKLKVLIRADQAGRPDPARSPILTNGQEFHLQVESPLDRDFYIATVGWHPSNLLAHSSEATIKLSIQPPPKRPYGY